MTSRPGLVNLFLPFLTRVILLTSTGLLAQADLCPSAQKMEGMSYYEVTEIWDLKPSQKWLMLQKIPAAASEGCTGILNTLSSSESISPSSNHSWQQ